MLDALQDSGGSTVAIEENDIINASRELSANGLYVEPTCAHAAAGFSKMISTGQIDPTEHTVIILTGTGLKSTRFYEELFEA